MAGGKQVPKADVPVEVVNPPPMKPGNIVEAVEHVKQAKQAEQGIPLNPADPHSACVPQAEYDAFVRDIRNQMSEIREQVDDLQRIVTQPEGAVTFLESAPRSLGEVPWYGSGPLGE